MFYQNSKNDKKKKALLSRGFSVLLLLLCYVNVPYLKKNVINNFVLYKTIIHSYDPIGG